MFTELNSRITSYTLLFISLELINMIFLESMVILFLTMSQILIVLMLIASNKLEKAFIWHIIFNLTACDYNTIDGEIEMMSYPALKLIGPLTISYIILGLIWLKSLSIPLKIPNYSLFYQLRKLILWLMISAAIWGIIGIFTSRASIGGFISPFRYMLVAYLHIEIFGRLYYHKFMLKCTKISVCLLIASPIASFISFFLLSLNYTYSTFDSFISNAIFVLAPCMILFLLYKIPSRVRLFMLFSLTCFLILTVTAGRGAQFLILAVTLFILTYIVYFGGTFRKNLVGISFFKTILPFCAVCISFYGAYMLMNVGQFLAANKLNQFVSLFTIFNGGQLNIDEVSTSPYIRIAEILNIIDNGIHNPVYFLIGKGYGSYYTDSLGLFNNLDLSNGAFGDEAINTGRFDTAHSMYPNALLFHGIIGFILICRIGFLYLKKIKYTPLILAAFVFLLYSLYYNVPLMNACILFLFSSEAYLKYYKSKKV